MVSGVNGGLLMNNIVNDHAQLGSGSAFLLGATATSFYASGNMTFQPGPHSAGNFVNNAGVANVIGVNPSF